MEMPPLAVRILAGVVIGAVAAGAGIAYLGSPTIETPPPAPALRPAEPAPESQPSSDRGRESADGPVEAGVSSESGQMPPTAPSSEAAVSVPSDPASEAAVSIAPDPAVEPPTPPRRKPRSTPAPVVEEDAGKPAPVVSTDDGGSIR